MKKISQAQNEYFKAKAMFETVQQVCSQECSKISGKNFEETALLHDEVYDNNGYYLALGNLRISENNMLIWAHEQVQKLPQYRAHAARIQKVITTKSVVFRPKVIELAARLSA